MSLPSADTTWTRNVQGPGSSCSEGASSYSDVFDSAGADAAVSSRECLGGLRGGSAPAAGGGVDVCAPFAGATATSGEGHRRTTSTATTIATTTPNRRGRIADTRGQE